MPVSEYVMNLLQGFDRGLLVAFFQVSVGQRLVRVVLVRVFRDTSRPLDSESRCLVRIAFGQRFLSGTHQLLVKVFTSIFFTFSSTHLKELRVELIEREASELP